MAGEKCTSIEPIQRAVMCQKERHHRGMHRAVIESEDGTEFIEWHDLSRIRAEIDRARRRGKQ